jgi:hypothetical protein
VACRGFCLRWRNVVGGRWCLDCVHDLESSAATLQRPPLAGQVLVRADLMFVCNSIAL